MIHFENTAPACRAVVRTVGLFRLTLLAEPYVACRLHGERGIRPWFGGGQGLVACIRP